MDKKRLLYIMGIDWEWIYQRPQILAEKLAQDYEVTVVFPRSILQRRKARRIVEQFKMHILWTLPYQEKNAFIGKLAFWMNHKIFHNIKTFDLIYVGYPLYARYIPQDYKGMIIYDCMDNHEALYPDQKRVGKVLQQEQRLVQYCDLLIVSARKLQKKMDFIAGYKKSVLIRNGMMLRDTLEIKKSVVRQNYDICYIGTISEWFDEETVRKSLAEVPNIQYQLIGPGRATIENERVTYHGTIAHDKLGQTIEAYDCLVMPFKVNEIVASVDPVKLYEYIAFGKCIVSVFYEEIERFGDFVYFYKDADEYIALLKELSEKGFPPKYTAEQQKEFLNNSTWESRYQILRSQILAKEDKK